MKKKVLIVHYNMCMGGVEKSLISFIDAFKNIYDITLFLSKRHGVLLNELSSDIKVFESKGLMQYFGVSHNDSKKQGLKFFIKRFFMAIYSKMFTNSRLVNKAVKQQLKFNSYDAVICYKFPTSNKRTISGVGCIEFIRDNVSAEKKVVFVHGDFASSGLNSDRSINIVKDYNSVLCVSESVAEQVKAISPILKNKVDFLYNIIDSSQVIEKAKEKIFDDNNNFEGFNIISVSRLSEEKGLLRFLHVLARLKNDGKTFKYTIVGDGKQRKQLEKTIKVFGLQNEVQLLGSQENPYKYFNNKDLFVLPSYHESFGIVLVESMILGVPVLTTKTISAEEVVGSWGFICENSEDGLYKSLSILLNDKEKLNRKKSSLINYRYKNDETIQKFNKIINSI